MLGKNWYLFLFSLLSITGMSVNTELQGEMGVLPSKILHPGWHANMSYRKPKPLSEKRIQPGFTQRKGQPSLLFGPLLDWGERRPWEARREFFISSSCSSCCCGSSRPSTGKSSRSLGSLAPLPVSPFVAVAVQRCPSGSSARGGRAGEPARSSSHFPHGPRVHSRCLSLFSGEWGVCLCLAELRALWYFSISLVPSAPCLLEIPQWPISVPVSVFCRLFLCVTYSCVFCVTYSCVLFFPIVLDPLNGTSFIQFCWVFQMKKYLQIRMILVLSNFLWVLPFFLL